MDKNSNKKEKGKKGGWWKRQPILRKGVYIFSGLFFLTFTYLVIDAILHMPPMHDVENPRMDLSTQLISMDGKMLTSYHQDENRVYASLDEISPWVPKALIATEDCRFYNHSGVDPMAFPAILKDLITRFRFRGGSTLTQQLARNLYNQVGKDDSPQRKFREAVMAVILESRFTKEEILQAYLNTSPFYGNKYGIEMGAQALYGKHAMDLELKEAAMLVGLLKGPAYYSPTRHPDRALARRNTVLNQMLKFGELTEDERAEVEIALQDTLLGIIGGADSDNQVAQANYFKGHVKTWLEAWAKAEGRTLDLYGDGLKVYVTVDSRMQRYAEKAVKEHLGSLQKDFDKQILKYPPWKNQPDILEKRMKESERYQAAIESGMTPKQAIKSFEEKTEMRIWTYEGYKDTLLSPKDSIAHYLRHLQTGFMVMDPMSGQIRAWVGGADYALSQYDHVATGRRQVGSTFKPFVYGAAIENGVIQPCQKALDIPWSFEMPDGSLYTPENSGGGALGAMSYKKALAMSLNQVTASVMKQVTPEKACEFAKSCGIQSKLNCVPSLCLGTTDLTVYEMVGAYCSFVNNGTWNEPYFISRIEDRHGNVLYTAKPDSRQAMDPNTAYAMVNMLQGCVDDPVGTGYRLRGKYKFTNQLGGKTGTTQNNTDGWYMGISPALVGGAWVGCDDQRLRFSSTSLGQGANAALPIWAIFLRYTYADRTLAVPRDPFRAPQGFGMNLVCPDYSSEKVDTTGGTLPEYDK
jgi:penicillin-binding protein 1A